MDEVTKTDGGIVDGQSVRTRGCGKRGFYREYPMRQKGS
jgi:hypothetical protein